jgi:hypothetical protein
MPDCGVKKCATLIDRIAHEGAGTGIRDQGAEISDYRVPVERTVNWYRKQVKIEF